MEMADDEFLDGKEYPSLDIHQIRVVLVEMTDRVLLPSPPALSKRAQRSLEKMGVELRFNTSVVGYEDGALDFKDGSTLPSETVIWAAGIKGNPLSATLGVPLQRGGRVQTTPALNLPDDPTSG